MAFSSTTGWGVDPSAGSDTNGGGWDPASSGTNYANQSSPQVTYTDLVIDASTSTKITSAANPFTSVHVGNIINITSGTGFTVQRVQIVSVTSNVATCDKSVGSTSSSGGHGVLGGSLQTITEAQTLSVLGNTINIKSSATVTITTVLTVPNANMSYVGYQTNWADGGTRPTITTSTNSVDIFKNASSSVKDTVFDNLVLTTTAGTPGNGISAASANWTGVTLRNCKLSGFARGCYGDNGGSEFFMLGLQLYNTEITSCSTAGVQCQEACFFGCYVHGNSGDGWVSSATTANGGNARSVIMWSIFSGNNHGAKLSTASGAALFVFDSVFYNNSSDGIDVTGTFSEYTFGMVNTILYDNGGWGLNIESGSAQLYPSFNFNNAYGANTSGNSSNSVPLGSGSVTLSGNPFTNAGSGNFALNSTSGAGAACKAAGFPGAIGGSGSTGNVDIGAVQSAGGSSGGLITNPGMTGGMRG
jgi:hypothetical protein